MSSRRLLVSLCIMSALCAVFFFSTQRWIADAWMQLATNPDIQEALTAAMRNQRKLASLDPAAESDYRAQFERTQALVAHVEILRASREAILWRYEVVVLTLFGLSLLSVVSTQIWLQRRIDRRLIRLKVSLEKLAAGETIDVVKPRRDTVGIVERMVADTSHLMGKRLKQIQILERWQESSRRLAHEIRTPLTAIQLELNKLVKIYQRHCPEGDGEARQYLESIHEELRRLSDFTDQFAAFAKIRKPALKSEDLVAFVREFAETYAEAWPRVRLVVRVSSPSECRVSMDKRMIRQVLVNLCDNSASAMGSSGGSVALQVSRDDGGAQISVTDTGPGIVEAVQGRLFEPYVTTKPVGEGMGLGLAISKKIMLEHEGDLELVHTGAGGTEFRLRFAQA